MDARRTKAYYRDKARVIKAMAHPGRLAIIDALSGGEKCVCKLREVVGSDITTVSKHLAVMKKAGLLEDRKQGQWVYYRLKVPCILRYFDCVDIVLNSSRDQEPSAACR
jgi:DNA-binding transcriptional ArsR family regulator